MNAVNLKSGSELERILASGQFAVTGEIGPPKSHDAEVIREKCALLNGYVDAANITDNQTGIVRMSSIAAGILIQQQGLEPVIQMTCRDRNRLAMQADILGAYYHGVRNMLCLSGDHCMFGDHPDALGVFDIDSIQLINMVKTMRDEAKFQGGADVEHPPKIFIGAAINPFADPFEWRVHRLAKKIDAGVDFIQTQCIYNMDKFREFVKQAVDMGLTEKCYILAGITPMKNVGMARYMQKRVPGIEVPEPLIDRLKGVDKKNVADEGIQIAVEQVEEMKEMKGVHGVHMMAIEWEHMVPEIAERCKVLPRPEV